MFSKGKKEKRIFNGAFFCPGCGKKCRVTRIEPTYDNRTGDIFLYTVYFACTRSFLDKLFSPDFQCLFTRYIVILYGKKNKHGEVIEP